MQTVESFSVFFSGVLTLPTISGGLKVVFPVDLQKISLGAPLDNTSLQVSSLGGCLRVPWIENKENPPGTRQH